LNDPASRNAMSEQMADRFVEAIQQVRAASDARVLVISGAGKAFSAGGHLDMLEQKTSLGGRENRRQMEHFYTRFLSVLDVEIPVIAAINGHAIGAAFAVALACDIRVAVDTAKLGLNFVRLGLHPGMGCTHFLPRLIGYGRAAELLFTGAIITASEAHGIGLVNRVSSSEAFGSTVEEIANAIASAGPQAVRETKLTLRTSGACSLSDALRREAECQARSYSSSEFAIGLAAAREKKTPSFPAES
ncbi:MAG: enoyl-CoA hydratase/isomerase family protein, partial [Bdellovibrionales bacterium]|nr:enoyl-CoA hydratase/isomerase family protein [Bdellovibrionales bacterium]